MGRPKGAKNKKGKNFQQRPEDVAKILNIPLEEAEALVARSKTPDQAAAEVEAVISYAYGRDHWVDKACKNCGKHFAATYKYVSYCSIPCRVSAMEAMGLGWNPLKSEDQRYEALGIETPGIVPPFAMEVLKGLSKRFAAYEADHGDREYNTISETSHSVQSSPPSEIAPAPVPETSVAKKIFVLP